MSSAEVVEREPEREHRLVVRQSLAVGIRQPGESSDVHPTGQVEPLHAACPDFGVLDLAADLFLLDADYRGRVILLPFLLWRSHERFDYLSEVAIAIPRCGNDRRVRTEPVREDRRASRDARMQLVRERLGVFAVPLSGVVADQQLGVAIHRRERVAIAFIVKGDSMDAGRAFFQANETPLLVDFHSVRLHVMDAGIHEHRTR